MLGYLVYFKCKFQSPTSRDDESVVMGAQEIYISENMPKESERCGTKSRIKNHHSPFQLLHILHTVSPRKENSNKKQFVDF